MSEQCHAYYNYMHVCVIVLVAGSNTSNFVKALLVLASQ